MLAACGKSDRAPPPPPPVVHDAAVLAWPIAPLPTPPIDIPWPPVFADVKRIEDGVPVAGMTVYGVTIPTSQPRLFVSSSLDLRTLEAAWGKLSRSAGGYAVWWNPALHLRARFDVAHPTPRIGRGIEIAPYASTLDRIANYEELVLDIPFNGVSIVPPGEWDLSPVFVRVESKPARRVMFTVRVDGPPVDETAVIAKLTEIWGEPTVAGTTWTFAKGKVTARRVETQPALELTLP